MKNLACRDEAYLKAAEDILSESKFEHFEEHLQKEGDRYKSIMEMSALEAEAQTTK